MPRYPAPTRPRHIPSPLMATLSAVSSVSSTSASSASSAHTSAHAKRCFYCPKILPDDSARSQHIANSPECTAAQRAALTRATERLSPPEQQRHTAENKEKGRQGAVSNAPDAPVPVNKRPRVTVETVPDETEVSQRTTVGQSSCESVLGTDEMDAEPGPSTQAPSGDREPGRRTRRYRGLFVEEFPDSSAGAPLSSKRVRPPDLDAYMQSCGRMADPETFEAAELLMTSGLTDADKDRHLKSRVVSTDSYTIKR